MFVPLRSSEKQLFPEAALSALLQPAMFVRCSACTENTYSPYEGLPQGNRQGNIIALFDIFNINTFSINISQLYIGYLIFYVELVFVATLVHCLCLCLISYVFGGFA